MSRARQIVNEAFAQLLEAELAAELGSAAPSRPEREAFACALDALCDLDLALESAGPCFGTFVQGGEA